jgi:hypothetical protein
MSWKRVESQASMILTSQRNTLCGHKVRQWLLLNKARVALQYMKHLAKFRWCQLTDLPEFLRSVQVTFSLLFLPCIGLRDCYHHSWLPT